LFDLVLEDAEILFLKIHDRGVVLIDHRHVEQNHVRVDFDYHVFIRCMLVGLTPFALLIAGVFLLWSLLRLRRSRRVLRASFIDRKDAQQREGQRRWNNSKSGSVQHDNSAPNKIQDLLAVDLVEERAIIIHLRFGYCLTPIE